MYEYRFRHIAQADRQRLWDVLSAYIHHQMGEPRSVLDPATGRAEFLRGLPTDVERWAVDLEAHADDHAEGGIHFIQGNALTVDLPDERFDGVFISNFLEHLRSADEVALLLNRMHAALRPGGRLAIMGPNFKYCARHYFDFADHVLALSHLAVEEHLFAARFTHERTIPRFLPYSFRGVIPPSPVLARAYLRVPLAWRLLGKQFLVIGRKLP